MASVVVARGTPVIIGCIALVLFAVAVYFAWNNAGTPTPSSSGRMQNGTMAPEHVKAIDELVRRLEQNPGDGKGWAMLARTYAVTGRYTEAVGAYEKAANLIQSDPVLLVDYADVLAMVNGKKLQGKPLELIGQALKIDPGNVKGLALMGSAAFQVGDYGKATEYWNRLLPELPPDSPFAKQISAGLADARALAGGQSVSSKVSGGKTQQVSKAGRIAGVVKLSPGLSGKARPTDTVFVFARAMSGQPMPIAVMRAQVSDLPIKFVLDDSMAMMPSMKLSDHKQVTVSAKISRSGNAMQQSGDLRGEVSPVDVGADNVQVVIDSTVP